MTTFTGGNSLPTINVVPRSWSLVFSDKIIPNGSSWVSGTLRLDCLNNSGGVIAAVDEPVVGWVETFALIQNAGANVAYEPEFSIDGLVWHTLATTALPNATLILQITDATKLIYPAFLNFRIRIVNAGGVDATLNGVITLRAG